MEIQQKALRLLSKLERKRKKGLVVEVADDDIPTAEYLLDKNMISAIMLTFVFLKKPLIQSVK